MHWITRPLLKILGNITGAVPGAKPLVPSVLEKSLKSCNFVDIKRFSAAFTFHRFPIFVTKIFRHIDNFLRQIPIVKSMGWLVYFIARKK